MCKRYRTMRKYIEDAAKVFVITAEGVTFPTTKKSAIAALKTNKDRLRLHIRADNSVALG